MTCAKIFDKNSNKHSSLSASSASDGSRIILAKITSASGIKGYVKLTSYASEPESLFEYRHLEMDGVLIELEKVHASKNGSFVCKINISNSLEDAKKLCNKEITISQDMLPKLEEGEYYLKDLIGFRVFDSSDIHIGDVCGICDYGAGDIVEYKILNSSKTVMLPLNDQFIKDIDLKCGCIFINSYDVL